MNKTNQRVQIEKLVFLPEPRDGFLSYVVYTTRDNGIHIRTFHYDGTFDLPNPKDLEGVDESQLIEFLNEL